MRRTALRLLMVAVMALVGGAASPAVAGGGDGHDGHGGHGGHGNNRALQDVIALPNGFRPEGIAIGRGSKFYAGSLVDGAIYRGSVRTGAGAVFIKGGVPGQQAATGLKVDSRNRLWVSGATGGTGRVYNLKTGAEIATLQLTTLPSFINDVVVTKHAAYFTDSTNPALYVVPIARNGDLGAVQTLPLTGDIVYVPGEINANGIVASRDGKSLIIVQTNKGLLFKVDASTGVTTQIDLGTGNAANGDGLLRDGSTLYVVQNFDNKITAIKLSRSLLSGRVVRTLTNPNFDIPTTIAEFGKSLFAVNARFSTPPTPDTPYSVVRVSKR